MKVAFAGTPDFAATILRGLIESRHGVTLAISQPDARRGRGRKTVNTPVAALALEAGVPLSQPERIGEVAAEISHADALVVAAYGQILRPDVLYAAPHGAWNVHASLLPAYRGAAPIERAIMAGETETGVSIMKMDEGLDSGPVALQKSVPIHPDTTGGELAEALAHRGSNAIVEVLNMIENSSITLYEQDSSRASYAYKVSADERVVSWERSAGEVHDRIRALSPHIGARTYHHEIDGPVKILRSRVVAEPSLHPGVGGILVVDGRIFVGCGTGTLEIQELQLPGAKVLPASEFLRGNSLQGAFTG